MLFHRYNDTDMAETTRIKQNIGTEKMSCGYFFG
jgi:hypothetical protein